MFGAPFPDPLALAPALALSEGPGRFPGPLADASAWTCGTPSLSTGPWATSVARAPAAWCARVPALLGNSTGGLNGTFQDFTQFLPSLGINSAVMSALPNVAVVDSGIFGIPVSLAVPPPPPPPSCNGLGCLWNAVSGVVGAFVGAIVNGIEGFAGAVWSAVQAATEFLEAAAAGLYHLAETAVSAAVSALKAVGGVLLGALAALLAFVKNEVIALLSPVFQPILDDIDGYEQALSGDLVQAQSDLNNGNPLGPDSTKFWEDTSGNIFYVVTGLGTTIGIVLGVVEGLSLGAAFLVPIVIGLLLTGAAASGAAEGSILSSSESAFESLTASTALYGGIGVWKSIFGGLQLAPAASAPIAARPQSSHTLDETLATLLHIASVSWAASVISVVLESREPEAEVVVGLVLGVLGMMLAGVAKYFSDSAGAWISLAFSAVGAFLAVVGLLNGGDRVVGLVAVLLDLGGGLLGGCVVGIVPPSLCP